MTELLDADQFGTLFDTFEHTAFRLETRDRYNEPVEAEPLRRFFAGEPDDREWFMDWYQAVRRRSAVGKRMERVRVVTEPHSDYIRWEMDLGHLNVEAGEDIRYLPRDRARELELPEEDFWLFDSVKVARLVFGEDDVRLPTELITDPAEVVRRCHWRDVAWHYAVPLREYAGS